MKLVQVTWELLEEGRSSRGGWSRKQVSLFRVPWPLQTGWAKRLIGTWVSAEAAERFLRLRDRHFEKVPESIGEILRRVVR